MMFSEFCETTGLHGWKYLAKVKYRDNCKLNWQKLSKKTAGADWGPLVLQGGEHFGFWIGCRRCPFFFKLVVDVLIQNPQPSSSNVPLLRDANAFLIVTNLWFIEEEVLNCEWHLFKGS